MPTNDYLPFATGSGSTILTQAAYNSLVARSSGFQQGIADEYSCNKVWRQASVIGAMIAQFIVDNANVDCLDDGNIAALEAKFAAALQANLLAQLYGTAGYRKRLAADLNLYVSPAGNDSNAGTSAGTAFATLQKAWNYIVNGYDLNGFNVVVNMANGTYAGGVVASGVVLGLGSGNSITFRGNVSSPASVVVSTTNANAVYAVAGAAVCVAGFTVTTTGTSSGSPASGLVATLASINITGAMIFGSCAGQHIWAAQAGEISSTGVGYTITGPAQTHWSSGPGSFINMNGPATITINNTPAFSTSFAGANLSGGIQAVNSLTFSGGATGLRYTVVQNGVINTANSGANYLPGNAAGTTGTGGQYT